MHHPVWKILSLPEILNWSYQGEGDLGQRMGRVVQRVTQQGEPVILMGTDCPGLTAERLQQAAQALEQHEACLVPVSDGGYSLLGLHQYDDSLFEDIPWSTSVVAELTRQRIAAQDWSLQELGALHDIDEPDDLIHLPASWRARYSL